MLCIENGRVILENCILEDGVILIDDRRICAVGNRGEISVPADTQMLDAGGAFVGPGFVDIHAHGGGGAFFWADPQRAAAFFLERGTTSVLPALYTTQDLPTCLEAMDKFEAAMASDGPGRIIRGVYMEGPYLNPDYGASRKRNQWLRPIDEADYKPLVDRAAGLAKLWVVAPEREGIEEFVRYVKNVDPEARFSVGHSCASPDEIRKLKPYGLNQLTHCMDATGRRSDWLGTRGAGPDEACFLDADMYAELISDSGAVHVNPHLQKLILQVKGTRRVILISDNSGRDRDPVTPERLQHMTDLSFDAEGNLGGSRLSLDLACRNVMRHTGCDMVSAFRMAATNPARAAGLTDVGVIAPGKLADLVLVDAEFAVQQVILRGEVLGEKVK